MRELGLEERVRRYVAGLFCDGDLERVTSVRRFYSGNRHHVHHVTFRDPTGREAEVVTRVSLVDSDEEREQASKEAAVLEALRGGVAPRLLAFDDASERFGAPTMCIEFLDGDEIDLASATPTQMERVGRALAAVHDTPMSESLVATLGGARSISEYVDEWIARVASYWPRIRGPLPDPARELVERTRPLVDTLLHGAMDASCFQRDEALVLLHGDVGPGNVLWTDRPVLIDWEYARFGDPADEIAYIFAQHALAPERRRAFWSGYADARRGAALEDVLERVGWWEPVTLFASGLWWLERWSRRADAHEGGDPDPEAAKPQSYYLQNAVARLERVRLADPPPGSARR